MQTAQRDFEQTAGLAALYDRHEGRADRPGVRLALAIAGLAALVGWGVLSHAWTGPSTDAAGITSSEEARLDGRGKWIGYTSP